MREMEKSNKAAAEETRLYGLLAEFDTPDEIIAAAESVRDAGYTKWDVHSPFPVHGMDGAMGIRRTILPMIVFGAGAAGTTTAIALQWFTNAFDYPFLISGKPFFSLPAFIPVAFELTILFAAVAAVVSMFAFNRLPEWHHPVFSSERFRRATDDRFFIVIEARDPKFDPERTGRLLRSTGATAVETLEA